MILRLRCTPSTISNQTLGLEQAKICTLILEWEPIIFLKAQRWKTLKVMESSASISSKCRIWRFQFRKWTLSHVKRLMQSSSKIKTLMTVRLIYYRITRAWLVLIQMTLNYLGRCNLPLLEVTSLVCTLSLTNVPTKEVRYALGQKKKLMCTLMSYLKSVSSQMTIM